MNDQSYPMILHRYREIMIHESLHLFSSILGRGKKTSSSASIPRPYANWHLPKRYEIRTLLGVGSYGHVCEAFDSVTKKKVAVKKIPRAFEELIDCKRILREIALLGRLFHGNVVALVDLVIPGEPSKFEVVIQ